MQRSVFTAILQRINAKTSVIQLSLSI